MCLRAEGADNVQDVLTLKKVSVKKKKKLRQTPLEAFFLLEYQI